MNGDGWKKCDSCSTHECEYTELLRFIKEYNEATEKNYELEDCPDKSGLDYTCDLLFKDTSTKESLYIEIKEIRFGVGKGTYADILLGANNAQNDCADLIYYAIYHFCNEAVQSKMCEFAINIPRVKIYKSEKQEFYKKLAEKLMNEDLASDSFIFCFDGKDGKIEILFHRKDEKMKKLSNHILFEYDCEENNTLIKIFDRVTDINLLMELINKNLQATSQKKFPPSTSDKKLLLNVLKLPPGYDLFFCINIEYIISNIVNMVSQKNSEANESYLLYFCEDYMKVYNNTVKYYGDSLFIIPVIRGVFTEPTCFYEEGE